MQITRKALKAHNLRKDFTFNDAWNVQHNRGTQAERMTLASVASDCFGPSFAGNHRLTEKQVQQAGHSLVGKG